MDSKNACAITSVDICDVILKNDHFMCAHFAFQELLIKNIECTYCASYMYNLTCITVCIENVRYSSYIFFCNTTAN